MSEPMIQRLVRNRDLPSPATKSGPAWSIRLEQRDLDSNIIDLLPGESIGEHVNSEVDVQMFVISGEGTVGGDVSNLHVSAGDLIWLAKNTRRSISAGDSGLRYLTTHVRRAGGVLQLGETRFNKNPA